jgi:hypothetical protein
MNPKREDDGSMNSAEGEDKDPETERTVKRAQTGSEEPHRRERKFFFYFYQSAFQYVTLF